MLSSDAPAPAPSASESTPAKRPNLSLGTTVASFEGSAPPGKVAQDLADATEQELAACFDELKSSGRPQEGTLQISLRIEPNGATSGARAGTDTLGSPAFTQCVVAALDKAHVVETDRGDVVFQVDIMDATGSMIGVIRAP